MKETEVSTRTKPYRAQTGISSCEEGPPHNPELGTLLFPEPQGCKHPEANSCSPLPFHTGRGLSGEIPQHCQPLHRQTGAVPLCASSEDPLTPKGPR